jgi:tRNA modification GTPase
MSRLRGCDSVPLFHGRPQVLFRVLTAASTMRTLPPIMRTSALTGAGIPELQARMLAMVCGSQGERESGMLTNARQAQAVTAALEALAIAEHAVADKVPHEMLLLDLYGALRQLDSLTGETTSDDVLNLIFSSFCIGK